MTGTGGGVDRHEMLRPGALLVLGEFSEQCRDAFVANDCTRLVWHRSKKVKEGLRLLDSLSSLRDLDLFTHMSIREWEPPAQLTRLAVSLRDRARGTVVRLDALEHLDDLLLEGGHAVGMHRLRTLRQLTLDRASVDPGTAPPPELEILAFLRVEGVDLADWIRPGLLQLHVQECTVTGWDALATSPGLERVYVTGTYKELIEVPDLPPLPELRCLSLRNVRTSGRIPAGRFPLLQYGGINGAVAVTPDGWLRRSDGSVSNGGSMGRRTVRQSTT